MENLASFWNVLEGNPNNNLITNYSWLSCQFLLGSAIWASAQKIGVAIGKPLDLARVTALPKALGVVNLPLDWQNDTFITYQSAIALKLSRQWNEPIDSLTERLIYHLKRLGPSEKQDLNEELFVPILPSFLTPKNLNESWNESLNQQTWRQRCEAFAGELVKAIGPTIVVSIQPKGFIQLHLSKTSMAIWLQAMQRWAGLCFPGENSSSLGLEGSDQSKPSRAFSSGAVGPSDGRSPSPPSSDKSKRVPPPFSIADIPFEVIYAHGRSCSLLRLAHAHELITLQSTSEQTRTNRSVNCPPSHSQERDYSSKLDSLHPPWIVTSPPHLHWGYLLKTGQNDLRNEPRGMTGECHPYPQSHIFLRQIVASLDQYAYLTVVAPSPNKRLHHKLLSTTLDLSHGIQAFDAHTPLLMGPARDVEQVNRHQVYLGLLLVAQGLLRNLLLKLLSANNGHIEELDRL